MLLIDTDFAQLGDQFLQNAIVWLPNLIAAFIVLLLARSAANWAGRALRRVLEPSKLGPGLTILLVRAARIGVLLLGAVAVLFLLRLHGIAISFVAGLGITGLLLAFALQEIAKNLAAGILLLFQRPFNIGDRIKMGEHEGIVQDIDLRATRLRTDDNREILLPNAGVYTGIIVNLTRYPARRHSLTVKLSALAPLEEALATLAAAASGIDGVREQPTPEALLIAPGDLSVEVRYWVSTKGFDYSVVNSRVAQQLRVLLVERGWL